MGAIGDRRSDLCRTGFGRMVVPIITLTAFDVGFQIADIVDRGPVFPIGMPLLIAPIGQRHIVVDPDEIDLPIGPQRIEVEVNITAAILRLIAKILRPISGIADLGLRPEQGTHLSGQGPQRGHRREAISRRAYLRQASHFRRDAKGLDPARRGAECSVVQDEPRQGPFRWAMVAHRALGHREIRRCGCAEKRGNFSRRRC